MQMSSLSIKHSMICLTHRKFASYALHSHNKNNFNGYSLLSLLMLNLRLLRHGGTNTYRAKKSRPRLVSSQ